MRSRIIEDNGVNGARLLIGSPSQVDEPYYEHATGSPVSGSLQVPYSHQSADAQSISQWHVVPLKCRLALEPCLGLRDWRGKTFENVQRRDTLKH